MKMPKVRIKFISTILVIALIIGGFLMLPKIRVPARHSDAIPENIFIKGEVNVPKQAETSSVSIFSLGHSIGRCSGVIVKENETSTHVITAKHCINVSEENYVDNNAVTFIVTSTNDDLAYLIVNGKLKDKTPAKLATKSVNLGEAVYHIGYPNWNEEIYKAVGNVSRKTKDWVWAELTSRGGCSGGGIFNAEGKLVGILWGGLTFEPITIFEPLEDIKIFLEKINQNLK